MLKGPYCGGQVVEELSRMLVSHADLDGIKAGEHIQLGKGKPGESIQAGHV